MGRLIEEIGIINSSFFLQKMNNSYIKEYSKSFPWVAQYKRQVWRAIIPVEAKNK